ncbi:GNAT family N-acetyltransferase [Anaerosporobacter faecicola]|uniref:GNAT family N-acetyltransferase n=1 Tax=Anaerosporobacter faecicola TaxID=2718714 RepID=UPI00143A2202|nr:GNAT family N-acetyltransferase [Anaerosporobacter faecicola]
MTIEEQRRIVEEQFAIDYNCTVEDFQNADTIVTLKTNNAEARKFEQDSPLSILSYRGKLVITASEELLPWCQEVLKKHLSAEWCMDAGSLIRIDKKLNEFNCEIDQAHLFFLPKYDQEDSRYEIHMMSKEEIAELEDDERIDEAFLYEDYIEDVLGAKIVDEHNQILAVAGATNNSNRMWEMGVNSFVDGKGYGQSTILALKNEILKLGKVPFYGTAMSHLASQSVAMKAGMTVGFTELRSVRRER